MGKISVISFDSDIEKEREQENRRITSIDFAPGTSAYPGRKTPQQIQAEADMRNLAAQMQQSAHDKAEYEASLTGRGAQNPNYAANRNQVTLPQQNTMTEPTTAQTTTHGSGKFDDPSEEEKQFSFKDAWNDFWEDFRQGNATAARLQAEEITNDSVTPMEAAALGAARVPMSIGTTGAKAISSITKNEEDDQRVQDMYEGMSGMAQQAQQTQGAAYGAGQILGDVATMNAISGVVSPLVGKAATAIGTMNVGVNGANAVMQAGRAAQTIINGAASVISSALTFGIKDAITEAGSFAMGEQTAGEYFGGIGKSAASGAIFSTVSAVLSAGGTEFLRGLNNRFVGGKIDWTAPFAWFTKEVISGMGGAGASIGFDYATAKAPESWKAQMRAQMPGATDAVLDSMYKEEMKKDLGKQFLMMFFFTVMGAAKSTSQQMDMTREAMGITEDFLKQNFSDDIVENASRYAFMTPEEKAAFAREIEFSVNAAEAQLESLNGRGYYGVGLNSEMQRIYSALENIRGIVTAPAANSYPMIGEASAAYDPVYEQQLVKMITDGSVSSSPEAMAQYAAQLQPAQELPAAQEAVRPEAAGVNAVSALTTPQAPQYVPPQEYQTAGQTPQDMAMALMEQRLNGNAAQPQEIQQNPLQAAPQRGTMENHTTAEETPAEADKTASEAIGNAVETAPKKAVDRSALEPVANTLGDSGGKALVSQYDGDTPAGDYASEFVQVYNAAKNGKAAPATDVLTEAQKFAATAAGMNDAEKNTVENPVSALENQLNHYSRVKDNGLEYTITRIAAGFVGRIDRDNSVMGGMISDARRNVYTTDPLPTRESAVSELISVAQNNHLIGENNIKEAENNGEIMAEVSDREGIQQPAVSREGTGGVLDRGTSENGTVTAREGRSSSVSGNGRGKTGRSVAGTDGRGRSRAGSGVGSGQGADLQSAAGGVNDSKEPEHISEAKNDGVPETAAAPASQLPEPVQAEIKQETANEVEPKGGNFVIPDEGLKLPSGEKARFKANIAAIKTLRTIMADQRMATPEEQAILSKYVGWGGLANAFDQRKQDWAKEYKQLKGLLSESEYNAEMHSTLNAHYTDVSVIRAMYSGLQKLGFTGGAVMEPSAGVGHFAGAMPAELRNNLRSLTMVELDEITGNIAKSLYPNADVRVQGFEHANIPDNYMDLAISNVPFGNYAIVDKSYPKSVTSAIHNYFFAKSLDKVRPGGIVCFITSRYTMDARESAVRSYLMERADLLGAIRLPDSAFKGNAGTEVVTDIIILKKRAPGTAYSGEAFLDTGLYHRNLGIWEQTNEYFQNHPEMVLGEAAKNGSMYRGESLTYTAKPGKLEKQIEKAFSKIDGRMDYPAKETKTDIMKQVREEIKKADGKTKDGSFVKKDGKIFRNQGGELVEQDVTKKQAAILSGGIEIRDIARELLTLQQIGAGKKQIDSARNELNRKYDEFVKSNGPLHAPANKKALMEDADGPFLMSLENYNKDTKAASKADIFSKNTITPHQSVDHVDNIGDGLAVSINETGSVDLHLISKLLGKSEAETEKMLIEQRLAFKTPDGMESAQQYLSGNVRAKLKAAEALATIDKDYQANVEELKKVVPADIPAQDISVRPGATWIPPAVYGDFAAEILGGRNSDWAKAVEVTYIPATGQYKVDYGPRGRYLKGNAADISEYGTQDKSFIEIFEDALNSKDLKVYYPHGKDEKAVLNRAATIAVKEKKDKILSKFQEWMWSDKDRVESYEPLYNDTFNCMAVPNYDGGKLVIDGLNAGIELREHQANAVQRIIMSGGNVLLAHGTGAGKTLEMASACMKLRQIGAVRKPMVVVPKNLLGQWQREFYSYYPGAKILVPGENDFSVKNRKMFANKIATGDYDAVIITYEHFEKVPLSGKAQQDFYQQQVNAIIAAEETARSEKGSKGFTVKQLAKKRAQLEAKIAELNSVSRDENNIEFESLGVDALFVDEAHNFKNLFYTTQMRGVSDLGNKEGSKRAYDLYMKVRYLQQLNGGRGIVFGTATPVMNSVVEMYTMQRYLQGDLLEQKGIGNFDAWVSEFGDVQEIQKMKAGGDGYEVKQSLSKYRNMAELQQMFRAFADVVTSPPGLAEKLPKMKTGGPIVVECEPSEAQVEYLKEIGERAENVRNNGGNNKEDNVLKIYGDGKKMSYTQRMIDTSLPYEEGGKVLRCVDNVLKEYNDSADNKGVQLIFCDRGVPGGQDEANGIFIYNDIKNLLVAGGIPAEEIAFAQNYKSDAAKAEMQKRANDGEIRVLIGSTQAMGTGLNIQKRAVAMHELNAPDRPGDIEQNRGRIIRQGNTNKEVSIYTYITKKTFDSRQWDNLKRKGAFIHQAIAGDFTGRTADGDGDFVASAAEIAAIASDNPLIIEQNEVSQKIAKLEALELSHTKEVQLAKRKVSELPQKISELETNIQNYESDVSRKVDVSGEKFAAKIEGKTFTKRADAGAAIIKAAKAYLNVSAEIESKVIGSFGGFDVVISNHGEGSVRGAATYGFTINFESPDGTAQSLANTMKYPENRLAQSQTALAERQKELTKYEGLANQPFDKAGELASLRNRESEIMEQLNPSAEQGVDMGDGVQMMMDTAAESDVKHDKSGLQPHPEQWEAKRIKDGDPKAEPKSVSEILAKIEHDFGFNITEGHVRGKGVRGQFNSRDKGIRTKIVNDLPADAHELGHALDQRYSISGSITADMRKELLNGLSEEMKSRYKSNELVEEGIAEFCRKFLQNRDDAAIEYPKFTDHFLKSLSGKDRTLIMQLADDINALYSIGMETAASSIRLREDGDIDYRTAAEKAKDMGDLFYQNFIDSDHGIKVAERAMGGSGMAYILASNSKYSGNALAETALFDYLPDANGAYVGPSLKTALQGVNCKDKKEYLDFNEYLIVRHGPERLAQGKDVLPDRQNTAEWMNKRRAALEAQYPNFEAAGTRVIEFERQLTKTWGVGYGLIDGEVFDLWNQMYPNHVPLYPAKEKTRRGAKSGYANQTSPYMRAKGSKGTKSEPIANIMDEIYRVVNTAVRNNVMLQMRDCALGLGADANFMEQIPTPVVPKNYDISGVKGKLQKAVDESGIETDAADIVDDLIKSMDDVMLQFERKKPSGDIITVLVNGKPEYWKINDPQLLSSLAKMSPAMAKGVMDSIGVITRTITANTTGKDILWSVTRNSIRDVQTFLAYIKNKKDIPRYVANLFSTYWYAGKQMLGIGAVDPIWGMYQALGGDHASYASYNRDYYRKARKKMTGKDFNPLDIVTFVSDTVEAGPRFAVFKTLVMQGVDPQTAFYEAMDITVNFRRGGAISRDINKLIPYFNAGVQGADKFVRFYSAEDQAGKGKKTRAKTVASRISTYIVASAIIAGIVYALNFLDDEKKKDYQQLSTYQRNNYISIPTGDGHYIHLAKGQSIGWLSTFFVDALDYWKEGNEHAFDDFYAYTADEFLPGGLSDAVQLPANIAKYGADLGLSNTLGDVAGNLGVFGVVTNLVANRDFLGRPIYSSYNNGPANDDWNGSTSKLAYWIGQAFGLNPKKIDYVGEAFASFLWKPMRSAFPMDSSKRDLSLGVKGRFTADNRYSTDIVNWLYDYRDNAERLKNSDENDRELKFNYAMSDRMADFYSTFNKLNRDNKETGRDVRQLVLDMLFDYRDSVESEGSPRSVRILQSYVRKTGETNLLPAVMPNYVQSSSGAKFKLNDKQYYEFQTQYLNYYYSYVEQNVTGRESTDELKAILQAAKNVAQDQASQYILVRGFRSSGAQSQYQSKYPGVSDRDLVQFMAQVDLANDDGSLKQAELVEIIDAMVEKGLSYDDAYTLFHSKYDSDRNNPYVR